MGDVLAHGRDLADDLVPGNEGILQGNRIR
jgi:hypothetical protein